MREERVKYLALKLYSWPKEDRQWVLDNLDKPELDKIVNLLDEIEKSNLVPDRKLIDLVLESVNCVAINDPETINQELSDLIWTIDRADHQKICWILQDEEAWIISVLFSIHNWRWQEELTQSLSASSRMDIKQYQTNDIESITTEVRLALLYILNDMLASGDETPNKELKNIEFHFETVLNEKRSLQEPINR